MGNIIKQLKATGQKINGKDPEGKLISEKIKSIADDYTPTPAPSGKKTINDTSEVNVANFETAQVVDVNLVAENIKKGVTILGITGTYEGETPVTPDTEVQQ